MQNDNKHCIWLTFNSDELDDIIFQLGNKFNSPVFQPHCTLIGRTDIPLVRLKSAIINIVGHFKLSIIHIDKIDFSADYWKSYYVEPKEKHDLIELHRKIANNLEIKVIEKYLPHISLMYNSLSDEIKKKITFPIKQGESLIVRSIQITECNNNIENWKPVFEILVNDLSI